MGAAWAHFIHGTWKMHKQYIKVTPIPFTEWETLTPEQQEKQNTKKKYIFYIYMYKRELVPHIQTRTAKRPSGAKQYLTIKTNA